MQVAGAVIIAVHWLLSGALDVLNLLMQFVVAAVLFSIVLA